jgi:hypothetical protein
MDDLLKFFDKPTLKQKENIKIRLPDMKLRLESAIQLATDELNKNILKNRLTTINVASDMVDTTTIPSPQRSRSRSRSRSSGSRRRSTSGNR